MKITKILKLVTIGLIFLLGLYFTANFTHKDFVETFINEKESSEYLLIDVRTVSEYEKGTIPNAVNYPLDSIRMHIDSIKNQQKPVIIFCQKGLRGYLAELILNHNNIENVVNVAGGFKLWKMFSTNVIIPEPVFVEKL